MSLQPLGHRILVRPDAQPEQSESGLILPQDHDHVPVSGTVVSVGPGGDQVRYRTRQEAIKDCCEVIESVIRQFGAVAPLQVARDEVAGLLGSRAPEREVNVGDRVVFPAEAGLSVVQDGEAFIILNEDDVAVLVADDEEEAAA